MQHDSGSGITIISSAIWRDIGKPKLIPRTKWIEAYDGHRMNHEGIYRTEMTWNGRDVPVDITVVTSEKKFGLIGRDMLPDPVHATNDAHVTEKTFSALPAVKGVKASMKLKSGATPMFCRARKVPLPMEEKVNQEIDKLVAQGILKPVDPGGVKNASPVVWQMKKNGSLRMCADYRMHVNDKLLTEAYPLPDIETVRFRICKLHGADKFFAKIDLSSAYYQIELDEEAQEISIINTTRGLFKVCRLQQGFKNASAIFQKTIEECLDGIRGHIVFQDDVLAFGTTESSCQKRYNAIRDRLKSKGFTINEAKSEDITTELSFLGFKISAKGIQPDERLINKIKQTIPPTNTNEVSQFCGLVNFFGRLIPDFATKLAPISKLQSSKSFAWDDECQNAFDGLKKELASYPVIQPYSLEKEAIVTTGASQEAIGGILTQEGHPVIYVSRKLSKAERNYSNIEREALAIIWVVTRMKQFLMGRKFTLITDHRPLEFIYAPSSPIPSTVSARICRWAISLMAFDYNIIYKPDSI